jgi:hypothetical protein
MADHGNVCVAPETGPAARANARDEIRHGGPLPTLQHGGGSAMTAFNIVRFRVKPGRDQDFLDAHKRVAANWPGLARFSMVKTGDRSYCVIGEWTDMDSLAKARPQMIAVLDSFRDTLEDLGGGLGVTDPMSGPVVLAVK